MAEKPVKELHEEIKESAHKIWLAGLGALAAAEEEGTKLFQSLVEKGEVLESRGKEQVTKAREKMGTAVGQAGTSWEKLGGAFDEKVASAIKRMGVPSRDEINKLTKRVEELTLKVDQLKARTKKAK